ncbi:MAG TPA: leucine--tRNA ligase [Kofleriaceae bacterium]|nr:leucine--tRNA ligase [Kofleriaceae bacterium]
MPYQPSAIEPRWQAWWDEQQTFVATEDPAKRKFYALGMFPYPSGRGLHVGHPASYIAGDVMSRLRRAQGYNVLQPMGYDAFGLPAEQRAIDEGIPPQVSTDEAIQNFRGQLKRMGFSYDWTREISTCDPAYYKWTQWIFTQLYERGLAYQVDMFVNWCPALGTVLANDEVIDGKSERGGHPVERRMMRQWMLRITAFAERLLEGLDRVDWPEATKDRQREWIGRSEGAEIEFPIAGTGQTLRVYTTRPDTIFGATYMVVAPEHPIVDTLVTPAQRAEVEAYQRRTAARSELDRQASKDKTGVDTGARAINPATGHEIPIWIADYVIYGYGTGAIMAVAAHDERDHAFAKQMGLPIARVITGGDPDTAAHAGDGALVHSGPFDGTPTAGGEAKRAVTRWLEQRGVGTGVVRYKMRDWIFARQRYWGEPIPVLKRDGEVVRALALDELPVVLPPVTRYTPTGTGESPLAAVRDWVEVEDPRTGERLERETDTMPGSAGAAWYFLRYCDPHNAAAFCARDRSDYWMPVDLYVGGTEHTVGHLLYSRMWQKALFDLGLVRDDEPFAMLRHNGMIQAFTHYDPDRRIVLDKDVEERAGAFYKRGTDIPLVRRVEKMSKRKGNVVNPDAIATEYGADAMRVYLCFLGPLKDDKPWAPQGIEAQRNWLSRVWNVVLDEHDQPRVDDSAPTEAELRVLHKAIKKVTDDIERLQLNTAISALHVATRELTAMRTRSRAILEPFVQLIQPFAPHLAEELWRVGLGHERGISFVPWPQVDERYATDELVAIGVQIGGKTRGEIRIAVDADEATALQAAHALAELRTYLAGKTLVRTIYKPGKILNLILS